MRLFDFLKNKSQKESEAKTDYQKALEKFNNNQFQDALKNIASGFEKDLDYKPLYELSAKCLEKIGAHDEAELFTKVIHAPNQFEPYKNLGTHFYESGYLNLALPFLERAVSIDSSNLDTVHDLALVYARRFQIEKAVKVLEDNHPQNDFWNYWFWCKLRILYGKTEGVEKALNELKAVLEKEKDTTEIEFPELKVNEVFEMLQRYNQINTPKKQIRDWHFIQYGGIILDYFDDSENYVAGGRYVASWGSNEAIKIIILILKKYIEELSFQITKIAYINNRNAEIIGRAIGHELNLSTVLYTTNESNENTLIVGADSSDFNDFEELAIVKEGQILFALNQCWLQSSAISPDIIGFMSQYYYYPWNGGGLRVVDAEKGTTEKTLPDERSEEEIAKDIFSIKPSEIKIDENNLNFYLQHKEYLKATGSKVNKNRFNFMIESPVPGSYFG